MSLTGYVLLGIPLVAVVYGILIFNRLVELKHNVTKAWSNIDVLLKQRHDELPKLVETCKQYMKFEQETLEAVMRARSAVATAQHSGDIDQLGRAETMMRAGLGNLFAVAEAYPELRSNETFQHLQGRVTGLENAIADRREFYNASVNLNNIRIQQFPDVLVANMFGFGARRLLKFQEQELEDVNLKALFGT